MVSFVSPGLSGAILVVYSQVDTERTQRMQTNLAFPTSLDVEVISYEGWTTLFNECKCFVRRAVELARRTVVSLGVWVLGKCKMNDSGESTILQNYLGKLIRLAERNLSPQLRRKVDEHDIGATVLRTVIRQARNGTIVIEESEDFWRQLKAITLNKVRKKARYWKAQKRNIAREQEFGPEGPTLEQLAVDDSEMSAEPTEEAGEALIETLESLNDRLDEICQKVLAFKVEGLTHHQIAERLDVSTRGVSRYVAKIQSALREIYHGDCEAL